MSTMRTHRRAIAGFTLIEMMVVLIIMAVIIAYAVPSYRNLVSDSRMAGEINDLKTDMEIARSSAIKQGLMVTLCQSPAPAASAPACGDSTEWNTGWIAFTDLGQDQTYETSKGDQLVRIHAPLGGTDTMVGTGASVTFNRMGGAVVPAGAVNATTAEEVTLKDSTDNLGLERCVFVSEAGTTSLDSAQTQNEANCL